MGGDRSASSGNEDARPANRLSEWSKSSEPRVSSRKCVPCSPEEVKLLQRLGGTRNNVAKGNRMIFGPVSRPEPGLRSSVSEYEPRGKSALIENAFHRLRFSLCFPIYIVRYSSSCRMIEPCMQRPTAMFCWVLTAE